MKQIIQRFTALPYRSFQFRLLIYLLLVGSIPLVCAMFVFYHQSSNYAKNEMLAGVNQIHGHILQQLRKELVNLDHISSNINTDYLVQKYMEAGINYEQDQEEIFKKHLDYVILRQKSNSKYITDICITFIASSKSICSDARLYSDAPTRLPLNKSDKRYDVFADGHNMPYSARFTAPLYDLNTSVVKGHVSIVMNLHKFFSELNYNNILAHHVMFDSQGNMIYKTEQVKENIPILSEEGINQLYVDHRKNIVSQQSIDMVGVDWISRIEVKNQFLTTTWRSLRNTLVVFFAVVLILSIISSFFFSSYITKPLVNLRALFKRAELGDLRAYWTSSSTKEINDLGEGYNQMLNRVGELIKQVKYEESLKKDAEIKALHYQLNPHFLYNTLNTIKWVAKIHKTPQISEAVSALVRLLQASLGKKGEFISIREEISLIKDYMEIQNFRYGEMVKMVYDIDSFASLCLVPRMLLQPLVENALIHGIEPANREGTITIKAWIDRDLLMCQVEDNGQGIPETELANADLLKNKAIKEKMSGIGISHIREKIKLYYGADYKMHIFSKPNQGTTVRLSLPIHRNEE
jgi:sensor histidine kinase YesM